MPLALALIWLCGSHDGEWGGDLKTLNLSSTAEFTIFDQDKKKDNPPPLGYFCLRWPQIMHFPVPFPACQGYRDKLQHPA